MNQAELLRYVVAALEAAGIPYMIGGSQASIYYGEPRLTQDIDIVAALPPATLAALLREFPAPDFSVSEEAAREAVETRGQFNIIHPASGLKVDIFEGRSDLHIRDIIGILRVSGGDIDLSYIAGWAERLGLSRLWQAVQKRATGE